MSEVSAAAEVPIGDLRPHPRNPRTISDVRFDHLKRTLTAERQMLQARPLIARRDGTVIAGNQRLAAAQALGWESIPVVYADIDDEQAEKWMLLDNRGFGEDDVELLAGMLRDLDARGTDLAEAGYLEDDVAAILLAAQPKRTADPDAVPEPPATPKSERGVVYELGPHRVMCGDSCVEADVAALVGTCGPPALMVTDPPYGVSVDHTWREAAGKTRLGSARGSIEGDDRFEWEAAYALADAPIAYVWHSALHGGAVAAGLEAAGFEVRQQVVWVKAVFAIGRAAYQWKHETCWYAVRKGASVKWFGGRSQSTVWEAASPIHIMGGGQDDQRTSHPTQKPLTLFTTPIENHTEHGEYIYDPFAGSGTSLIAAEQLGRRCLAMEIDPAFCDVIRQRYADYTDQPDLAP